MQGAGFFVGFFGLLIILALATADQPFFEGSFSNNDGRSYSESELRSESRRLSSAEAEIRAAQIFAELEQLEGTLRSLKLREPASPFAGSVTLRRAGAASTDEETEYLELRAGRQKEDPVDISDWYIESYVTEERAAIPNAARVLESLWSKKIAPVFLLPGETAYVITGKPPFNVSFHENACTGYLQSEDENIFPRLSRQCPLPLEEMTRHARVDFDNDDCYEFVEDIQMCEVIDETEVSDANISRACEKFVIDELNYNGCVQNHQNDPLFDDVGSWRLYLKRSDDLWRSEREILRLMDGNDKVVDVIEY